MAHVLPRASQMILAGLLVQDLPGPEASRATPTRGPTVLTSLLLFRLAGFFSKKMDQPGLPIPSAIPTLFGGVALLKSTTNKGADSFLPWPLGG